MLIRARAVAVSGALLAALALAVPAGSAAQDKKKQPKLDKDQQRELQAIVKVVDEAQAGGQAAPSDFPITLQYHFQKARDQRTFIPLTMAFPKEQVTNTSVVYYVRVVPQSEAASPAGNGEKDAKQEKGRPEYPFEDIQFFDLKAPDGGQYVVTRAISVPPGKFDLYVLMGERTPKDKKAQPPKRSLVKQAVTVPDFWSNELMTSSIILSNKAEQLSAPPSEADMAANPFIFGLTRLTPSLDNKFSKKDELSIIFMIYNTVAAQGGKPDVKVEYNFHQKLAGGGEKFFNRTEPQNFNAQTLPPQFDAAAGHQLVGGLSIPLASFPEGDYRLEIKISDVAGNKTKTENVNLSIAS